MIRLIAFDMDGTVLNDEKKILKETKEALEQAARAGIEIVPATGRPFCGISDEIYRLEKVDTVPVTDFPIAGVEVNRPVEPQIIEKVELELFGQTYPEPVRVSNPELPPCWK